MVSFGNLILKYLLMSFQVADRSNVDAGLTGICGKLFWLEVHEFNFVMTLLVHDNLGFEILCQVQEHLFLAQAVGEEKDSVLHVRAHDIDQPLVSLLTRREVILRVRERIIQV